MAENNYADIIEQLERDKESIIQQMKDIDLQMANLSKNKMASAGALTYINQCLKRFKNE